jgi:hypothetical protein
MGTVGDSHVSSLPFGIGFRAPEFNDEAIVGGENVLDIERG